MAKIKVVYFASIKEMLGKDSEVIELDASLSVSDLKERLASQYAQPELASSKTKAAIDQEFARDGDIIDPLSVTEVAFFPPVTGG
ncbi:MoaD/ThiS family protein [Marinomonas mediterranea]|jgi:Molybdopterin converting factor, small subunit|uniref:Molybdopterin synthase sulfur carrier subunit n=1 Tax=Marinomonas mediterranea (strain ATCC 700492 / JCM 21426 / NBRC 103028 / MMB-1) TaxID=717774 RepID=F2JU30_MARM1|nr:MoaD/ThiS family protein [Marinomonas mediterranea]ADZ91542.1 thiamineS protein [Marinomonas mediterranea MMB-1]WCN09506.1 MoaD/ThiS family protein [Marinomonas mediterranea]WCN13581.1 MoaD/ThiS family protein [Marinomonas mediterranea]WCN17647.1 MoaD/ThiS family protein [Marinomonas mediterranea MMB-1]